MLIKTDKNRLDSNQGKKRMKDNIFSQTKLRWKKKEEEYKIK